MKDRDGEEQVDPELLELFLSDLEAQKATLRDALHALRNNPQDSERLEVLMRAIQSIKGAAQLVDLHDVVALLKTMEERFLTFRKGETGSHSAHIDSMLKGFELIFEIAEAANDSSFERRDLDPLIIEEAPAAIKSTRSTPLPRDLHKSGEFAIPITEESDSPSFKSAVPVIDSSLLELLRTEVAAHVQVLSDGLLALETQQTKEITESLMRAAHSIKGSARVIALDAVVKLAHAMEDCFVAAQKGEVVLEPQHIDILLRAVDLFGKMPEITNTGIAQWQAAYREQTEILTAAIAAIRAGETPSMHSEDTPKNRDVHDPSEPDAGAGAHPQKPACLNPTAMDRTVRVSASKIERLVGLAGEVTVGARRLPPFSKSFGLLKKNHFQLAAILGELQEFLQQEEENGQAFKLIQQAKRNIKECGQILAEKLSELENFTGRSTGTAERLYQEVVAVRMRPFDDGAREFPRLVRDMARELRKKVRLEITGRATEVDRDILDKLDAPLTHLIRNALDHGIESPEEREAGGKPAAGAIRLEAEHRSGMLMISLSDDGRGIDLDNLRTEILRKGLAAAEVVEKLTESELMEFLFLPGFSTSEKVTEISGRGVGLNAVQNMVQEVGGLVRAVSKPGKGLSFHLQLPLTLSIVRTLLVEISGEAYAFPLARIDRCVPALKDDLKKVEGRQYFSLDGRNVSLVDIHQVLGIPRAFGRQPELPVVIVSDRTDAYGLVVDRFLEECDLVVRPLDRRLGKVTNFSATALLMDNSPVLIFDVEDLVRSIDNLLSGKRLAHILGSKETKERTRKRILVVDDSITVRELERKMLENRGYEVEVAVDGMDGWNAVRSGQYDLIITDVDMPRMNGIDLVLNIRQHHDFQSLPVIIVSYKDREEDRLEGLKAGANYYLTKSNFQDNSFIDAVADLIGEVEQCELP
jgi:two-component system sensor histidine kinase and response regulator WspE